MNDIPSKTIEEICEIIGDSFTKSELKKFLHHACIPELDDGHRCSCTVKKQATENNR